MESLDVVFIGYLNWWDTIPMPVAAFLSENDFSEKTVCTGLHERGKPSRGDVTDITKLCPQSTILDGLALRVGYAKKLRKMMYTCGWMNLK